MNRKKIIILISGLFVIAATLICGFSYFKMELIKEDVVTELGKPLDESVSKFATGNITDANLDLSNVNIKKTGIYDAYISKKFQKLTFQVKVIDTTPPSADRVDGLSFQTNVPVKACELVTNLLDESNITVVFSDGKDTHIYPEGGTVPEVILLTDESGNQTELNVIFQVIADTEKPNIKGVKSISAYTGDKINYMKGISATDNRDGDLTSTIQADISKVNFQKPGTYYIVYSVSDSSNNITTKRAKVTIQKDKAPSLKGVIDKTVFINANIDYLGGVTAIDERDGNISSSISVDSTMVNLKKPGIYKVSYSVSDSTGHKTIKTASITVKQKESVSPNKNNSKSEKAPSSSSNNDKNTKKDTTSGFQFFDVEPSGPDVNGDVPAGGKQDVGTWG